MNTNPILQRPLPYPGADAALVALLIGNTITDPARAEDVVMDALEAYIADVEVREGDLHDEAEAGVLAAQVWLNAVSRFTREEISSYAAEHGYEFDLVSGTLSPPRCNT